MWNGRYGRQRFDLLYPRHFGGVVGLEGAHVNFTQSLAQKRTNSAP